MPKLELEQTVSRAEEASSNYANRPFHYEVLHMPSGQSASIQFQTHDERWKLMHNYKQLKTFDSAEDALAYLQDLIDGTRQGAKGPISY